jgi:molybdopterin-guanine dinucleotide biosynthesis protein A
MASGSPPPPHRPPDQEEPDIAGVVLAGGASRRMGRDKATVRLPGTNETLLDRAVRHLAEAGADRVVIAIGTPGRLGPLPWEEVGDGDLAGEGPLAGLTAAFEHLAATGGDADGGIALVLAVDLPRASPPLLAWLAHEVRVTGVPGLLPVDPTDHRPQPLHAAYRPAAIAPVLRRALDRGYRRVLRALADAGAVQLPPPPGLARGDWHRNANTPLDLGRPPARG